MKIREDWPWCLPKPRCKRASLLEGKYEELEMRRAESFEEDDERGSEALSVERFRVADTLE